jgi:hypothetical protein
MLLHHASSNERALALFGFGLFRPSQGDTHILRIAPANLLPPIASLINSIYNVFIKYTIFILKDSDV